MIGAFRYISYSVIEHLLCSNQQVKGSGGTHVQYSDDGRGNGSILALLIKNFYFYLKTDTFNLMLKVGKLGKRLSLSHRTVIHMIL